MTRVALPEMPTDVAAPSHVPAVWLGAPCPGGLRLPEALAGASAMYGPRGVCFAGDALVVADSGNHRVLIWRTCPSTDHQPADIVLGQPTMTSETPGLLHLPTGVGFFDGRLFVADAWHHRILVWNALPVVSNTPPDMVLGQASLADVRENAGRARPAADTLYWPYGLAMVGQQLVVADTGNRRVLVWDQLPTKPCGADAVIGQDDFERNDENRGEGVGPRSFRWPHAVVGIDGALFIADAGNHRVLGWSDGSSALAGAPADRVIGQPDAHTAREWPYGPQSAAALRFPYAACNDGSALLVADTANNRVLRYEPGELALPRPCAGSVLAQPNMQANGENRWASVDHSTLCWPYGLALHPRSGVLAIADSGNNRVMLWHRAKESSSMSR